VTSSGAAYASDPQRVESGSASPCASSSTKRERPKSVSLMKGAGGAGRAARVGGGAAGSSVLKVDVVRRISVVRYDISIVQTCTIF
jgi:hypothetical protein